MSVLDNIGSFRTVSVQSGRLRHQPLVIHASASRQAIKRLQQKVEERINNSDYFGLFLHVRIDSWDRIVYLVQKLKMDSNISCCMRKSTICLIMRKQLRNPGRFGPESFRPGSFRPILGVGRFGQFSG